MVASIKSSNITSVLFMHHYVFQLVEITTGLLTKCSVLLRSGNGLHQHFQTPTKLSSRGVSAAFLTKGRIIE